MVCKSREDMELECEIVYKMIVKDHLTLRQIEELVGLSHGTICRRLDRLKVEDYSKYLEVERYLIYNKTYRFKKRYLWDEFDEDLV